MRIIALKNNDAPLRDLMIKREETLIVEMTQEEYMDCSGYIYAKSVLKNKNVIKELLGNGK